MGREHMDGTAHVSVWKDKAESPLCTVGEECSAHPRHTLPRPMGALPFLSRGSPPSPSPGLVVAPLGGCGERREGCGGEKAPFSCAPSGFLDTTGPYIIALQCGQKKGKIQIWTFQNVQGLAEQIKLPGAKLQKISVPVAPAEGSAPSSCFLPPDPNQSPEPPGQPFPRHHLGWDSRCLPVAMVTWAWFSTWRTPLPGLQPASMRGEL